MTETRTKRRRLDPTKPIPAPAATLARIDETLADFRDECERKRIADLTAFGTVRDEWHLAVAQLSATIPVSREVLADSVCLDAAVQQMMTGEWTPPRRPKVHLTCRQRAARRVAGWWLAVRVRLASALVPDLIAAYDED